MPKPIKFTYQKKKPFRDASLFVIVCEGARREVDYFRFFDGISSRVKIIAMANASGSAPKLLIEFAKAKEQTLDIKPEFGDKLWFVVDTDRWRNQLHEIRKECDQRQHWQVAQSNPCFEVWLYFHAKANLPQLNNMNQCSEWKSLLPQVIPGGFNSDIHPRYIEHATDHAKAAYHETGYFPDQGSTQLWRLAEVLLPLVKKELDAWMSMLLSKF